MGIYFKKQLCNDNGMAYPYADVIAGTWTIDKFYEMAKTAERDLNSDGSIDSANDIIGHCEVQELF